jgi:hypothetical protein
MKPKRSLLKAANRNLGTCNLAVISKLTILLLSNNKTNTFSRRYTMSTKSTTTPAVTETTKPVISVKDIKVANITIDIKTSCSCFKAANGHTWYLKGSTLEVTESTAAMKDRFVPYPKERLDAGRCGKIIGTIKKVADNTDLTNLLGILVNLKPVVKAAKETKAPAAPVATTPAAKDTAKKTTKPAAKKPAAKKSTAKVITPAPVVENKAPESQAA